MKLTKDLRLAFDVETEKHGLVIVHSLPIRRETLEIYFAELGAVFNACYAEDDDGRHLALVGPRIAFMALKAAAKAAGTWDTPSGVENGLVNEWVRLTNIAHADANGAGWVQLPLHTAAKRGIVDEESYDTILSTLAFFTAASRVGPKKLVEAMLPVIGQSLGWETGSWSFTEFIASLQTSTPDETSKTPEALVQEGPAAPAREPMSVIA